MRSLDKTQLRERDAHVSQIRLAENELREAIETFNSVFRQARILVEQHLTKLNNAIDAANNWREQIVYDQGDHYESRSDRWRESDSGQAYSEWCDTYNEEFPQANLYLPDEVDVPDVEAIEMLENLPESP